MQVFLSLAITFFSTFGIIILFTQILSLFTMFKTSKQKMLFANDLEKSYKQNFIYESSNFLKREKISQTLIEDEKKYLSSILFASKNKINYSKKIIDKDILIYQIRNLKYIKSVREIKISKFLTIENIVNFWSEKRNKKQEIFFSEELLNSSNKKDIFTVIYLISIIFFFNKYKSYIFGMNEKYETIFKKINFFYKSSYLKKSFLIFNLKIKNIKLLKIDISKKYKGISKKKHKLYNDLILKKNFELMNEIIKKSKEGK